MRITRKELTNNIYYAVYEKRCMMLFKFDKKLKQFRHINETKNLRYLKGLGLSFESFLNEYVKQ